MSIPKTTQNPWIQVANLEGPNGPVFPQPPKKGAFAKLEPIPEVDEGPHGKTTESPASTKKDSPDND